MNHNRKNDHKNEKGTAPKPFVAAKEGQLPVTKNTDIIADKNAYGNAWRAAVTTDKGGDGGMCKVICLCNQKGGVAKTTSAVNLGVGLAREGKKVLLIDVDPQGSLTASLGFVEPDDIKVTLATIMTAIINEEDIESAAGILHHEEGVDLLPANIELSALEITMGSVMSREVILKEYIEMVKDQYQYILLDCSPSLGMLTINAMAAADSIIIPVQSVYLPVNGLQQLIKTVFMVKRRLNRKLSIEGILLTMVDFRTNFAKDIYASVRDGYGSQIKIFDTKIPLSVRAAEASAEGVSIFRHCPRNKVAAAYENLTREVLGSENQKRTEN